MEEKQSDRCDFGMSLLKVRDFLQWLVEGSVLAIVVADMRGEIILMSDSAEKIFGDRSKIDVGKSIAEYLYTTGGAKKIMKMLRSPDYGGKGKLKPIRTTAIHTSGKKIPVEMSGSIIYDEDGNEIATMGVYQDLSERLDFEEKMDTIRQKLEKSEQLASIGKLVAGVAHEMNNPLTGINMFAHLALDDIPEDNPAVEKIDIVLAQAERCRKIISDLLDFSMKGTGVIGEMDFNETIDSVLSILKHHAKFKDIDIKKDLDPDLYRIEGNHDQLQQMLINLMLNRAETMNHSGSMTLKTRNSDPWIKIDVEDNGQCIAPENIVKIFDPFFSTEGKTAKSDLGLYVSHGIVTAHKGTIEIKSEPDKGTCFTILLPLKQDELQCPI